jgi:oryzin
MFSRLATLLAVLPLAIAAPMIEAPQDAQVVPEKYIVVLKQGVTSQQLSAKLSFVNGLAVRRGYGLTHRYDFGQLRGFAGKFDDHTIATLQGHDDVCANSATLRDGLILTTTLGRLY